MVKTQTRSSKPVNKKKKKPKTKKGLGKKILLSFLAILSILFLIVVSVTAYFISTAPSITQEALIGTIPSTIYDKNGEIITKLGGNDRILIDPSDIPENVADAVLSIEDKRFYDHNGVDFVRIGGAFITNLAKGRLSQGGSTITQQLIKLSAFSTSKEDQTIKRKIQEAWLAIQAEKQYTKEDILALYLNKVYLANNIYGFGTAAQYYFGKDVNKLDIAEAALLAGMVQAPNHYDPYVNPEAALQRRNTVLGTMLSNQKITQEEFNIASALPITYNLVDHKNDKSAAELSIDSYVQAVAAEISEKTSLNPYTDGLSIYTNLDMNVQNKLLDILNTTNYIDWANNDVQAAVTVVDPNNGAIVAMVGGRNINVQLGLNRATVASRSVGSTSKPLVDYGPAFEYKDYSTGQSVSDSPINYSDGTPLYNWDFRYFGSTSIRTALAASRNTPALRTLRDVGLDNAYAFLSKLKIDVTNNGVPGLVESNAIGFEASPLQMAAAYSAFANGGTYYKPFTINKIITRSGEEASYIGEGTRAMKDSTAYMITDILRGVPTTYATSADIPYLYHAGKSGTTNYTEDQLATVTGGKTVPFAAPDAWYVGYTKRYVVSTWVGYDTPNELNHYLDQTESTYAQLIYKYIMSYLAQNGDNTPWEKPDSVERYGSELYLKGKRPVYTEIERDVTTRRRDEDSDDDKEKTTISFTTKSFSFSSREATTRETTTKKEEDN
ncbi:PBP1A family penicillin-binding protein [Carnobacteriaceae bacterium zg-84]|uniref:transglycosylase domain-containing protein n=1 Tax=Granulicatella sp. zg-84 TaxID=2678503 RepID=UPI0013C14911|nr:PBP1A family penicillin-binding protein [Granulicatella sp. zg-84]NEW65490.1 PBP1A family penicillin-binding protein [Granulicatella sp. zg-84]QMI85279.1 PBP1A family penicillin-binding protein [Carnobacteriaceae bacterium zg-84]